MHLGDILVTSTYCGDDDCDFWKGEFLRWAPSIAAASHPWTLPPVPDITSALPRPISNIHTNTNTNKNKNTNTNTNINIAAASHPWTLPLSARHHNLLSQGLFGCPVLDALI